METQFEESFFDRSETVAMPKHMNQAHRQAPWRIQTQRGVLLLIVAILSASVLWVMVSVTVQAASAGLEIQTLEDDQEELQREIAGLHTQIAVQTSSTEMEKRAGEMGFQPINPGDITYMVIPGYMGREPSIKAPPPGSSDQQPLIKFAYTESLWEWLMAGIIDISEPARGGSGGISP